VLQGLRTAAEGGRMTDDRMQRDYERYQTYKNQLRQARLALRELLDNTMLPAQMWDDTDTLHRRFGREMEHVGRVWD